MNHAERRDPGEDILFDRIIQVVITSCCGAFIGLQTWKYSRKKQFRVSLEIHFCGMKRKEPRSE